MLQFLKANAMGISAFGAAVLTAIFAVSTFGMTARAVALIIGLPQVGGNFLANLVLKRSNGKAATT